jgi:CHAT domain
VLGAAFQARYRMVLYQETRLLRRRRLGGNRVFNSTISFTLAMIAANIALLRGPWLLRRFGVKTNITPLQYVGALVLFSALPGLALSLITPVAWLLLLVLVGLNYCLSRLQPRSSSHVPGEARVLSNLWTIRHDGDSSTTVVAPGVMGYFARMRLIGTVAWLAGQQGLVTDSFEELSAIMDQSQAFDLAEQCLAVAMQRSNRRGFKEFDRTRLKIRHAGIQVAKNALAEAEKTLRDIPNLTVNDETRRWAVYRDLTEARLQQEQFSFVKALGTLENARLTARLRLAGPTFIDHKVKAHLATLFAHAAEQRILILSALSRFDEAFEAAKADAEIISEYGDPVGTVYFKTLAAFMRTLDGLPCTETELGELERRLAEAESRLRPALTQEGRATGIQDNDRSVDTDIATGDSLLGLFSQAGGLLFPGGRGRTVEFQRAAFVLAVLSARCHWTEGALRCIDRLEGIAVESPITQIVGTSMLRAVALAAEGDHARAIEAIEDTLIESPVEPVPLFGLLSRTVLRAGIEWDAENLVSAVTWMRGVVEQVQEIGIRYAAVDVRVVLAATDGNPPPTPADVTVFPCLFGPVAFLWNIGTALMEFDLNHFGDGTTHIERGLHWLEDRRVFIETSNSVDNFKLRYGWLYDLAIESLLDQRRYEDALRLSERLRCMSLLVLNHYQGLDLAEVQHLTLWKNYHRIRNHIDELLKIAERQKISTEGDVWQKFLDAFLTGWTRETADTELVRLAGEMDRIVANLRREHPKFRQVQAELSLQAETIPYLQSERAILYYHFDARGRLWIVVIRSEQQIHCDLAPIESGGAAHTVLSGWVDWYVKILMNQDSSQQEIKDAGAHLADILLKPVLRHLRGITEVCVVPHGPLFDLPFHALVMDGEYAICRWSFSYLPTLGFIWQMSSEAPAYPLRALAVIDPDTEGELEPLGDSNEELEVLKRHFDLEVQSGPNARKEAFSREARRFPFIHVTAHSKADFEGGTGAYIRFAGSPNSDCRLRPRELSALHLDCFLCNLSSCQSGKLSVTGLSEIEGLATSFLVAGTRHVIASLWNIRDDFAPKLMDRLYSGPFIEQPGLALSDAQRHWALDTGVFGHPKFWAPFYAVERFAFRAPALRASTYMLQ